MWSLVEGSKLDTIHVDRPANSGHKAPVVAISDAKIKPFILGPHGRRRPKEELYIMTLSDASHHATAGEPTSLLQPIRPMSCNCLYSPYHQIRVQDLVIRVLTCLNSKMFIGGLNWETTDRKWHRISQSTVYPDP